MENRSLHRKHVNNRGRKRRKKNRSAWIFVLLIALVVVAGGFLVITRLLDRNELQRAEEERLRIESEAEAAALQQEADRAARLEAEAEKERIALKNEEDYQAQLAKNVFFPGVSINGVQLGGMTIDQGRTAVRLGSEGANTSGVIRSTFGDQTFDVDLSSCVHVTSNLEEVLTSAFGAGRRSSYAEAQNELEYLRTNGHDFMMAYTCDYSGIAARASEIADMIDRPVVDSTIEFDPDKTNGSPYIYTASSSGLRVDRQQFINTLTQHAKDHDLSPVDIPVDEVAPSVTEEDLQGRFVLRASAETSFRGSDSKRVFNIKKGCGLVNGTVVRPGEVFSMNDTLGVRSYSNGWKEANAYVSGGVDKQAGGGVCQLSTTLYNAVVKADLEVVERKNHTMPVSYVKQGLDATINSVGNIIDFKFRNTSSGSIMIIGIIEGKNIRFEIYGLPFETDEYDEIKIKSGRYEVIQPTGALKETYDPTLPPGTTEVKVARRTGSRWESTKIYYKNGKEVKRERLDISYYPPFDGEILYGPGAEAVDDWDYSQVTVTN